MRSSLKIASSTPIQKDEHTKLATLWQSLQDHNDSLFFRAPVDLKDFSDYPLYVQHPMDLSTVNRKFREMRYRTVEEVLDDLQLIWDNCRTYNPPGTWIYNISITMDKAFKRMVRSYFPDIDLDRPPQKPLENKQKEKEEADISELDIFPAQEVAYHLKLQFVERMRVLPPSGLEQLTKNISYLCPSAFVVDEGGRARILVDNIDALTFPLIREKLEELVVINRKTQKRMKLI